MGSDGRPHHEVGFSFLAVQERCAGARRSHTSAKNLAQAGERGTELHLVLQKVAEGWAEEVGKSGQPRELAVIAQPQTLKLPASDAASVLKVLAEIQPFFSPEPGMLFGTEERIDLRDPDSWEIISFGYYDLFLKLGRTVLVIDHKFVRKEVEGAENNRQGHALAVSVWQQYEDVEDVIVVFTMPECGSSIHRFTRTTDGQRLIRELVEIIEAREQPVKVISAGDHCVYCKFRGTCKATLGVLKEMVTGIETLAVPATGFDPAKIRTAEDMALLRYWGDTAQPVIDAIKEESIKWAQEKNGISCTVNGQHVEYRVQSRKMNRKLGEARDVWNHIKSWFPIEAWIASSKLSLSELETNVVQVISGRLIDEGKTPSAAAIAKDFSEELMKNGLLSREEGCIYFLKRVKASAKRKPKSVKGGEDAPDDNRPDSQNDS